jgi:hypothetical protein
MPIFINANSATAPAWLIADRQEIINRFGSYSVYMAEQGINFYAFNRTAKRHCLWPEQPAENPRWRTLGGKSVRR